MGLAKSNGIATRLDPKISGRVQADHEIPSEADLRRFGTKRNRSAGLRRLSVSVVKDRVCLWLGGGQFEPDPDFIFRQ
jgi:hypothetical protein